MTMGPGVPATERARPHRGASSAGPAAASREVVRARTGNIARFGLVDRRNGDRREAATGTTALCSPRLTSTIVIGSGSMIVTSLTEFRNPVVAADGHWYTLPRFV